jgi:hypothetical protein
MTFDLSSLNAKYRNLSEIAYSENAWRIVRVNDTDAEKAYKALLKCWSEKFLGFDHFSELRGSLRDAYVALRSAIGKPEILNSYFSQLVSELNQAIGNANNFLSTHERELLAKATTALENYAQKQDYPLTLATQAEIKDPRRKVSIVLNGHEFANLGVDFGENSLVYPSITRALASLNYKDQNHVVLVLAPDQNLPINQMRLLMVGGITVKVTFLVPSWWSQGAAKYFNSQLWFGLDGDGVEYIKEVGEFSSTNFDEMSKLNTNWDISVPARPLSKQVEKYINAGPIECNLLLLNQGLVMPIEKDATRIAVIRKSTTEYGFELDYTTPKRASENKEVVFSFAQVSERSFIREQAEKYLGDELPGILKIQERWKSLLNEQGLSLGWPELARRLSAAGVDKAHRVRWWGQDPNFIRPQSENDFQKLLIFLGLQGKFISDAFEATRQINYARDTAGTVARKALASAITDQVWADIQKGSPSEINLDDIGEASFIASKVETMQTETIFAGILQVRRILGGQ